MEDHLPDVAWMVALLAIWSPDDEIFEFNYRYVRQRDVIEAEFDNDEEFFTSMPTLTEKEIRRSNRIRIPLKMRQELELKRLE